MKQNISSRPDHTPASQAETNPLTILIIDDEEIVQKAFKVNLEYRGYSLHFAHTGKDGIEAFQKNKFDVVITDIMLPDVSGIDVVREIIHIDKDAIVLVITGYASVKQSIEALKLGAADYFPKPVNFEHLDIVIQRAYEHRKVSKDLEAALLQKQKRTSLCGLSGISALINETYNQIDLLAETELTVLIQGETGTGKEVAAEAIHKLSPRKDHPFIPVNCASLTDSLLESELFGHVKGSFTGATHNKKGLFEAAQHGTILLDELEAASTHTQVALLRIIDRKEIMPVGSNTPMNLDVRILATTNKDLEAMVSRGEFREDLYFRFIESVVNMPPLRKRSEDIPLIIKSILEQKDVKTSDKYFSPKSMECLKRYSWPGNVRELKNLVINTVSISKNKIIGPSELPERIRQGDLAEQEFTTLREQEKKILIKTLNYTSNNKAKAAKILGLSRGTIYSLLKKHHLE